MSLRVLIASLAVPALLFGGCAEPVNVSSSGGAASTSAAPTATTNEGSTEKAQPAPGTCAYNLSSKPAKPVDPPPATGVLDKGTVAITLNMTAGPVVITMDRAKTPCTINSFESLAGQGYFDGTKCHRLMDNGGFLLQCGDPTGTGRGGPGYTFADETDPADTYPAGTVAMANAGPDTNGSQFFLVFADTALPPNYTVFGHMDKASIDVVAKMAAEGQDGSWGDGTGKPNNPCEIKSISMG